MGIFEKLCEEMIEKIESIILLNEENHDEEILAYLEDKRKEVEKCRSMSNDERQIY